jgi:hypothetical protein
MEKIGVFQEGQWLYFELNEFIAFLGIQNKTKIDPNHSDAVGVWRKFVCIYTRKYHERRMGKVFWDGLPLWRISFRR